MISKCVSSVVLGGAFLGVFLAGGHSLRADVIANVSTGLDSNDTILGLGGLSDAHWTVSEQAGGNGAGQTVFPNNADWYNGWVANNASSDWIARNANITNNGNAPYTFQTTFDLTGYTLSSVSLAGSWAIDDTGTLNLNGTQIGSLNDGWTSLTAFNIAASSNLFVQGVNTLSITITSDDDFLEGVRLQGSVIGTSAVPEPATIISSTLGGLILLAGFNLRRRIGAR